MQSFHFLAKIFLTWSWRMKRFLTQKSRLNDRDKLSVHSEEWPSYENILENVVKCVKTVCVQNASLMTTATMGGYKKEKGS